MNSSTLVLWIYVGLLTLGGLMGFLKAKSRASLIMSLAFAIPIALVALGVISMSYDHSQTVNGVTRSRLHFDLADILIAILLVFFGMKFIKGKKFMPAGLMCIASLVALVLRLFILH